MAFWHRNRDPKLDYAAGNHLAGPALRPFNQFVAATQLPTPGAMQYGLESQWLAWRPMIGPAIGQAIQFRTIYDMTPDGTQYLQASSVTTLTGLGGLAHGQIVLQPLSDPYNG